MQSKYATDHWKRCKRLHTSSHTPVIFFLSLMAAGLVLQRKAGVIRAIVAGSGGAGATGLVGHWVRARQSRGVAPRQQPPSLVHDLHSVKHSPWVVSVRTNRAFWLYGAYRTYSGFVSYSMYLMEWTLHPWRSLFLGKYVLWQHI